MRKNFLPSDFIFGASTSAFQIEGSTDADGKGRSIWDVFTRQKGKIRNNDNADETCNHYIRFQEDINLMKNMSLDAYRFSVSWPRIYPDGRGQPNIKGLDFYSRLADSLLEAGITPYTTLFHWDLPAALQDRYGGFANRAVADYFSEYVHTVVTALGDRIKNWITINEPFVFASCGHLLGIHAPGEKSPFAFFRVLHNLLVAHGLSLQVIRENVKDCSAGISLNLTPVHPAGESGKDGTAAFTGEQFINHITLSPLIKGKYPEPLWGRMKLFTPDITEADLRIISGPNDFIGINVYTRDFARYRWYVPFLKADLVRKKNPEQEYSENGKDYTSMGWEIYPEAVYEILMMLKNEYGNPPVLITENGAAFSDQVRENRVADNSRINFMKSYLNQVMKAYSEGSDVRGYFYWSLLDNFEWAEGLSKRFGLIHVDYETGKRTVKESGKWYRDYIRSAKK